MFKFKKNIVRRFKVLIITFFALWGIMIIYNTIVIMTGEAEFWKQVEMHAKINKETPIYAVRGDILSDDGGIIVTNLPRYNVYIDFRCVDKKKPDKADEINMKRDSLWRFIPDSVYDELCDIFPNKTPEYFKEHIIKGLNKKSRYYRFYPRSLSYSEYKRLMDLPMFSKDENISGVMAHEVIERKNLYGNTLQSTLGNSRTSDSIVVTYGLEHKYNNFLKGTDGLKRQVYEMGVTSYKTLQPAEDGMSIQTTIDMELQDICEKIMKDPKVGLPSFDAQAGWLILMEVKTGDIKAVVNLAEDYDTHEYLERYSYDDPNDLIKYCHVENFAFAAKMEPGSIFKTISLAAALEEGSITPESTVPMPKSGETIYRYGKDFKDPGFLNWAKPEFGIADALKYSSNVAMVQFIDNAYSKRPQVFVDNVRRLGVLENYKLLSCEVTPSITLPSDSSWGKTTLCTQSYGYGVALPAINIVTFYAALANKGVMMRPRLVKAVYKGNSIVQRYPIEVLNPKLLKPSTVDVLHKGLLAVVEENTVGVTGRFVKSDKVRIAGKTGTAVKGGKDRLYSFCGYFPADAPEYALIVQAIRYEHPSVERAANSYGGGGKTSGIIFKNIAEGVMARKDSRSMEMAEDKIGNRYPSIKKGNIDDANYVLRMLGMDVDNSNGQKWGIINNENNGDVAAVDYPIEDGVVPNVIGMGAKDAVYLMRKAGLKVEIFGYGSVKSQSIPAGIVVNENEMITLILEP